jgi:hypothetical protein
MRAKVLQLSLARADEAGDASTRAHAFAPSPLCHRRRSCLLSVAGPRPRAVVRVRTRVRTTDLPGQNRSGRRSCGADSPRRRECRHRAPTATGRSGLYGSGCPGRGDYVWTRCLRVCGHPSLLRVTSAARALRQHHSLPQQVRGSRFGPIRPVSLGIDYRTLRWIAEGLGRRRSGCLTRQRSANSLEPAGWTRVRRRARLLESLLAHASCRTRRSSTPDSSVRNWRGSWDRFRSGCSESSR